MSLASYLVKKGMVEASELANCASKEFGIPLLDLNTHWILNPYPSPWCLKN